MIVGVCPGGHTFVATPMTVKSLWGVVHATDDLGFVAFCTHDVRLLPQVAPDKCFTQSQGPSRLHVALILIC